MAGLLRAFWFAAGCFGFAATPALACSCAPSESAGAQAGRYDFIAVVKVGQSWDLEGEEAGPVMLGASLTLMHVQSVLKGEMSRHVVVKALNPGTPACGISFRQGAEVLLLATGEDGAYTASLCDLPQFPLADFEAALKDDQDETMGQGPEEP